MINFDNIKQVVYNALLLEKFEKASTDFKNRVNQFIAGSLLLTQLKELIINSVSYLDDMISTALAYKDICKLIEDYQLVSFMQISEKQVMEIYNLYQNKAKIQQYSLNNFSVNIYNIASAADWEAERLSRVHFKVINPIVKHYMTYYNVQEEDVNVEDIGERIGYEIKISIKGVYYNQIYADIENDVMNIKKYLHSFEMTADDSIYLIIK